jgi:uncharacterized protein (DUF58 family)
VAEGIGSNAVVKQHPWKPDPFSATGTSMSDLLYALSEIFVGLMLLAILFGVILMVLVSGVLLDEARRTGVGWTRRRKRTVSAVNGRELALHPTRITPPPIAMHVSQRSASASNQSDQHRNGR